MPVRFKEDIHTTCDNCESEVLIVHECEQCYERENGWVNDELSEQYKWLKEINTSMEDLRRQYFLSGTNDISNELILFGPGGTVLPKCWNDISRFVCEYFKTDSRKIHLQIMEGIWIFSAISKLNPNGPTPNKTISTPDFKEWRIPVSMGFVTDVDNFISLISEK